MSTHKVLFVCLGNICRSPTAHGLFRDLVTRAGIQCDVDGAGTGGWHAGEKPDARAIAEAKRRGVDLSDLRARQVTQADFFKFDNIVAMDKSNLSDLRVLRPDGATAQLHLMLDFGAGAKGRDVPDPYYHGSFPEVFDMIQDASEGLLDHIIV